jgi:hypothetical protein
VVDGREVLRGRKRTDVAVEQVRRPQLALFLQLEDGCRCERLRQRCHPESSVRSVPNLPAPVCVAIRLEKLNGALPLHKDYTGKSFGVEVAHDRLQPGWKGRRSLSDERCECADKHQAVSVRQTASYAQLFWAVREWLVASTIAERLNVEYPFRDHLIGERFELVARLSSQVTLGFSTRVQRNRLSGAVSPSVALQLAIKTVN